MPAVAAATVAMLDDGRGAGAPSVAVIAADTMVDEVALALDAAGIPHGRATTAGLEDQVTVVPISVAKGLEIDGVVVVEPAQIVESEIQGLRALYVALTRADPAPHDRPRRAVAGAPRGGRVTTRRPGRSRRLTLARPPRRSHDGRLRAATPPPTWPAAGRRVLGDAPPVRIELWDGSAIAPEPGPPVRHARILSPDALRRIVWCPNELGLGRAYVAGEIEADGEIVPLIEAVRDAVPKDRGLDVRTALTAARDGFGAARRLGVLGRPLPPPPQEVRHLRGLRHSLRRDADAVSHHYDVGNDFYRIVLGPTMVYSCARFVDDDTTLEEAQTAKLDLVARKLGLHERTGVRLLDVGCGWGSMAIHAAQQYQRRGRRHHDQS